MGKYQMALGELSEAQLRLDELASEDQKLLDYIRMASRFQLGMLTAERYANTLSEWSRDASPAQRYFYELERLRYSMLEEYRPEARLSLAQRIQTLVAEIVQSDHVSVVFKLQARIISLFAQLNVALVSIVWAIGVTRMRAAIGRTELGLPAEVGQAQEALNRFEKQADEAWRDAQACGAPVLTAEALSTWVGFRVTLLMLRHSTAVMTSTRFEITDQECADLRKSTESAIVLFHHAGSLNGELRARMILADLLELAGKREEASQVAAHVVPQAMAMGYKDLESRAREHVEGRTAVAQFSSDVAAIRNEDQDELFAYEDDASVHELARNAAQARGLPADRIANLEAYLLSVRATARSRMEWCHHLQLLQDLRHEHADSTCFLTAPDRKVVCSKHNYETAIETPDWQALMDGFKRVYCDSCPDQEPKHAQPESGFARAVAAPAGGPRRETSQS